VRNQIAANLRLFLPGKWHDLRENEGLNRAIEQLLGREETRTLALTLIAAARQTERATQVCRIALSERESESLRIAAVRALAALPCRGAIATLEDLTNDRRSPKSVRTEAIQSLGQQAQEKGKPALSVVQVLGRILTDSREGSEVRQKCLMSLAASRNGCLGLLDALGKNQIPSDVRADVGRVLRNSAYQDLRNRAMVVFPAPSRMDPKQLPRIESLVTRRGDTTKGERLVRESVRTELQCLKCHTSRGLGGKIGPDLSAIGTKASRENLFESILFPNKAIADQFLTWVVNTKSGLVVTGLIVEETPEFITVRDANGKDTRLDKRDVETRTKSPNSMMPSDLLAYMTEEDLIDIVEYLLTLKSN